MVYDVVVGLGGEPATPYPDETSNVLSKSPLPFHQAFAIFCGLGIHNTMIYDQMAKAKAKQQVAIEV